MDEEFDFSDIALDEPTDQEFDFSDITLDEEPPKKSSSWWDTIVNAYKRGTAQTQIAEVLNPHEVGSTDSADIAKLQQAVTQQETAPASPALQKFTQAETFGEGLSAFADSPLQILSELTVESITPLIKHGAARIGGGAATGAAIGTVLPVIGTAAGAATGAIGGMASTSLNLEYSGSILESLKDAGADFSSMDSIKSSLGNPELMKAAKEHALLKGVPIAIFDGFSAGIAGKLFKAPAKALVGKAAQYAGELGTQMGLGAAGELSGQVLSGEKIQPGSILAEAVGELGTAPIEIAAGLGKIATRRVESTQKVNEAVVDQAIEQTTTGSPEVDAEIDAAAAIPEDQKQLVIDRKIEEVTEEAEKELVSASEEPEVTETTTEEGNANEQLKADAVAKLGELEKALLASETAEDAQAKFVLLAKAREAVRKIAGEPKTPTKKPLQKQIEKATGVNQKQEPITIKNVAKALKEQMQLHYRTLDEGIRTGQKMVKDQFITKVQQAIKEAPLAPSQISAILGKVKKTNLFTPGSISKLNDFIDRVSTEAEYAEKIQTANKLKKQVKKLVGKGTPKEKFSLRMLTALDPDEVNVGKFTEILDEVSKSKSVGNKTYTPLTLSKVDNFVKKSVDDLYESEFNRKSDAPTNEKLQEIQQSRAETKSAERMERMADKLGISVEELQAQTDDQDISALAAEKRKAIREAFVESAKETKETLADVNEENLTPKQKKRFEAIKSLDPSDLTTDQLKVYIRAVDRIAINSDFGRSENLSALARAKAGLAKIKANLKGGKILNLNWLESDYTASLPQALQAIFGLADDAATFSLNAGIKGIADAKEKGNEQGIAFVNMLNNLEKKQAKTYGKAKYGFTPDSQIRQGIYGELIKHDSTTDQTKALADNKAAIEATITTYNEVGKPADAAVVEKLYAPFRSAKSIEEVMAIMERIDKAGKEVTTTIIDWFKQYKADLEDYNEAVNGQPIQDIQNYSGERNWIREKPGKPALDEPLQTVSQQSTKVEQINSSKKFTAAIPFGKVLDFNLHSKAASQIEDMVFKMEAAPYMLQVREFAGLTDEVMELFGAEEGKPKTIEKANRIYKRVFDPKRGLVRDFENVLLGHQYKTEGERKVSQIMSIAQKFGYVGALSGLTQAPKQFSVLLSTAANLGRNMGMLATSMKEATSDPTFNEFFKGETVKLRGEAVSLLNVGDMYQAADALAERSKVSNALQTGIGKYSDKFFEGGVQGWVAGLRALTSSDASAARISYLAYYKDKLSDLGQEYQGLASETALRDTEARQEARAYAKQMVDNTQVASSPAELARAMKDKALTAQFFKAWLLPFGSFRLNKIQRLWSDYRALATGTASQRKAAVKDISGALAETVAFETIAWGLRIAVFQNLRELYRYLLDLDDDEDKDLSNKKAFMNSMMNIAADNLPLLLLEPVKVLTINGMKGLIHQIYLQDNDGASDQDFEQDTGISLKPKYGGNDVEKILEHMGAYGILAENFINASSMMIDGLADESDLTDEQKRMSLLAASLVLLNIGGIIPSDVKNPALKELAEQKKQTSSGGDSKGNLPVTRPRRGTNRRPRIVTPSRN